VWYFPRNLVDPVGGVLELEVPMRSFMSACIAVVVIAVAAAAILVGTVQESAASAFATSGVRLSK
jgi:hypothetical protein